MLLCFPVLRQMSRLPVWRRSRAYVADIYPRGGGTGTNGQALNQGIIVDMSRYMNRIIEINPEEGWVRVEAGVIKDQQSSVKAVWLFFCAGTFHQ